jgi:L-idonate 5-dehydrogenase
MSELAAERRSYAEASQADRAFDPTTDGADIERLKADVVVECSGSEPGIRSSLAAARPEGTVIVVGGGRSSLDSIAVILKELRVLGSFTYADECAQVIALLAAGALHVAELTSQIACLDDAPAAFERLRDAKHERA